MTCLYCVKLNHDDIRKAFQVRKPLVLDRVDMIDHWHAVTSPNGKPAMQATFFCDACGQTVDLVIEMENEPDPADWWKL